MKHYFLFLFFLQPSVHCTICIDAEIYFTYFAYFMPSNKIHLKKNICPDSLVDFTKESCMVTMQYNLIDHAEGILQLHIHPEGNPGHNVQASIPLTWNQRTTYSDDYMYVSCSVYTAPNS